VNNRAFSGILAAAVLVAACGDSTAPVPQGSIKLSADQVAAVNAKITQIAASHPELAWLVDSVNVVLKTGVEVDSVGLVTNIGSGPFYGVGVQRTVASQAAWTTFDLIMFNNPSNPTDFVIVDAFEQGSTAVSPTTATGSFGSTDRHAHLIHVSGATLSSWSASAGTVTFVSDAPGGVCPSFSSATMTCMTAGLQTSFAISAAVAENGTLGTAPTASLSASDVPGVLLKFVGQ
jgi:hypothetical protein